jgi:hypothetical protein
MASQLIKVIFSDSTTFFLSPNAPARRFTSEAGWEYGTIQERIFIKDDFQVWNGEDWVPARRTPAKTKVRRKFAVEVEFDVDGDPTDEDDEDVRLKIQGIEMSMVDAISGCADDNKLTVLTMDHGPAL